MQAPKKKIKYIQKQLFFQKKKEHSQINPLQDEKEESKPVQIEEKKIKKVEVINVKVANLRKQGYNTLVDWLKEQNHVYIGRNNHYVPGAVASKWANPFKVDQYGRDQCINRFKEYLLKNDKMMSQLGELKGKVLGCWCAPENCHGFVLAELIDSLEQ